MPLRASISIALAFALLATSATLAAQAPQVALPRAAGGVRIGEAFARVGLRCIDRGLRWSQDRDGGRCSQTPMPVPDLADAWVYVYRCGLHVCALTIGSEREGETQLQDSLAALANALTARYGAPTSTQHDGDADCMMELEAARYACLLSGRARYRLRWSARGGGVIVLSANGREGTRVATITVTYAQGRALAPNGPARL